MESKAIERIADDRLVGVEAIAQFIDPALSLWKAQRLLEEGYYPHSKEGRVYVASKRALLERWRKVTGGEGAPEALIAERDGEREGAR